MTQKKKEPFDPEKVICTVDDVEVDCKTWGDSERAKKEADEIESMMDFMWNYDS